MNYKNFYELLIERAKNRILNCYKEKHHIIPKCLNGTNEESNLVYLTAKEHFICHRLLCLIYPNSSKLKYALWMMMNVKRKDQDRYKISVRIYKFLKEDCATNSSQNLKGKKRPQLVIDKLKGHKCSEETKEKIKKNHWTKGSRSKEIRELISKVQKGKKESEEFKKKISNLQKGKKHSQETKEKISKANKGKIMSDESKLKISKANKGKGHPCSDESKLKISLSKLGKPRSEETKRKLSEAHKKRHSYNKDSTKKLYQEVSINPLPIYNEIYKEEFPL